MTRLVVWRSGAGLLGALIIASNGCSAPARPNASADETVRRNLFAELRPVKLSNCKLERFGEKNDGGYAVCANLLGAVEAGYSYGISGYDGWGCDVSRRLKVKVHQYDCFDLRQPSCPGGATVFHGECVAGAASIQEGRPFDTIVSQLGKNGDASKRLIVKMDVEGAEWDSLWKAPDTVFQHIDQFSIEFHHNEEPQFVDVVRKLKRFFYVAHVHFNNFSCETTQKPFPSWAYEVLFVNKSLGVLDSSAPGPDGHSPDAPNNPLGRDCQAVFP
jgi:hypothetical protein